MNVVLLLLRVEVPPGLRVLSAVFPLLTCATTLLALGRRLPLQNVLTAACIIASITTGVLAVAVPRAGAPVSTQVQLRVRVAHAGRSHLPPP